MVPSAIEPFALEISTKAYGAWGIRVEVEEVGGCGLVLQEEWDAIPAMEQGAPHGEVLFAFVI